jgi:hypothetical protein
MDEVMDLWAVLRQRLGTLVDLLREVPLDLALAIAAAACVAAFLLLVSRLRAGRAYRQMRGERDDLKQQLAALQTTYDNEIRWRRASEASGT